MLGTKTISDLITDPKLIKAGRINIIEAPVSSGKTSFALTALPQWAGSPEKVLYLIDTNNGEYHIQRNILTRAVDRRTYAFWDYNEKHYWGEPISEVAMPVMTYAGLGQELRKHKKSLNLAAYEYIICDEMQHLVSYQNYEGNNANLAAAEAALGLLPSLSKTKIVAISATPQKIRERFREFCRDVPYDKSDLLRLETFHPKPYAGKVEDILDSIAADPLQKTGILYTTQIADMKRYINYANRIGIPANGFWSNSPDTQKENPFTPAQRELRQTVLEQETIPDDIRLLVINAASETCIKIQGERRKVDYMIVHNSDEEVKTQVRGRYHGDLDLCCYHDKEAANLATLKSFAVPERYLNTRLYREEQDELCAMLSLRKPHGTGSEHYKWPTVSAMLRANGYDVSPSKKDKTRGGQHYYEISKGTNSGKS